MAQADCNISTRSPIDSTRRGFLSQAAALAVGGTALALAVPPKARAADDPVFALIAAHREINARVHAIEADPNETNDITELASAEMDLFLELIDDVVPTTLAGVVALVTYLDEVNKQDPWKFEDNYATPLIGSLATAFNRMAVAARA
jgi:hypothetical protein